MRTLPSSSRHDTVSTPDVRRAFREHPVATLLSTGLGVGFFPWAPGTAGSAVAAALAWFTVHSIHFSSSIAAGVGLLTSGLALGLVGVPLATRAARGLAAKDPGCVVIDEFAGQFVSCAAVPLFAYPSAYNEACVWIGAFLAFRVFDVWKPAGIRGLQELPEGLGIVVDDVLSGGIGALATGCLGYAASLRPWI